MEVKIKLSVDAVGEIETEIMGKVRVSIDEKGIVITADGQGLHFTHDEFRAISRAQNEWSETYQRAVAYAL